MTGFNSAVSTRKSSMHAEHTATARAAPVGLLDQVPRLVAVEIFVGLIGEFHDLAHGLAVFPPVIQFADPAGNVRQPGPVPCVEGLRLPNQRCRLREGTSTRGSRC